ncbi:DEAD-box ATP-dependent RNA helicase 57 [Zea mays]|uniref:RNA helicase n=1 Tax=Zea mays TaxID=4577 RepID=A0A1D6ILE1_MAIZE|nr:DEAD-box ATP-dependent RNA helicase 57 [Zea mays]XP_008670615.2 DEAD-box ATP-dependent RNA helicase 57 [Zea mays]ONM60190.1 DEAD-box ATP-dependent RNA helicase 57 [Zea mays]ONM60205.1 DEAD-box ATP-dependent RNA helicase 57 [Zea mays]|eukprot:XP_008670615.2 DEAD-box ATP-dependent RNA helicase 57 [Zea mays]
MENTKLSSALFAGTHFDRKRFAADFARFRKGPALPSAATPSAPSPEKKRKRKSGKAKAKKNKKRAQDAAAAASSDFVEGFSVFKGLADNNAELRSEKVDMRKDDDSVAVRRRKEIEREFERAAVLRKRFDIHIAGQNAPAPLESFEELISRYGCDSYLVGNLSKLGFQEPTPIQRQAMPILLSGRECFACAPTGSGKTLAFLFPLLMKIKPGSKGGVKAVILCPTRELAAQTVRECKKLVKGRKYYIKLMTKELSKSGNFKDMHCDILVSTPLRLDHAVKKRDLDLSSVEYLVLDESDKLFELGFVEVVDSVVEACSNPSIIRSLFSATLPDSIETLARTIMHDAIRVIVGRKNSASSLIKQKLIFAGTERGKLLTLRQNFQESLNPPVLIFVQSKERAKELYKELAFDDIRVDVIHADLSEQQRQDAVDNLRAGKTWVLIATEVIARGMDFKGVASVINYDFPESAAAYIHRIGRSGRAGRSGEAITFFTEEDKPFLRNIANVLVSSGCEVPSWIMALPKLKRKKHRVDRDPISYLPDEV